MITNEMLDRQGLEARGVYMPAQWDQGIGPTVAWWPDSEPMPDVPLVPSTPEEARQLADYDARSRFSRASIEDGGPLSLDVFDAVMDQLAVLDAMVCDARATLNRLLAQARAWSDEAVLRDTAQARREANR